MITKMKAKAKDRRRAKIRAATAARGKGKAVFAASMAAAFCCAARRYLWVNGQRVSELLKTGSISFIKIVQTIETAQQSALIKQAFLNDRQKELLFLLLEHTRFRRILSKSVPLRDQKRFLITAGEQEQISYFRLESFGGDFVVVDCFLKEFPVWRWKLKIKNERWVRALEQIMKEGESSE